MLIINVFTIYGLERKMELAVMCKKQATTGYYRMLTGDGGWVWVQTQLTLMQAQRPCRRSCIIGITSILRSA
jgi:hypothetical protein